MTHQRPSGPGEVLLPREIVLASAGTGKTFTLSSRMLGLLALGFPPETLLATTFTRKAAGEILNRLLLRLARAVLGDEKELKMAREALFYPPGDSEGQGPDDLFPNLLRSLIRDLHRVNVGTLDSLFIRIARSFSGDLGMPPDWTISDEPTALRLESEALQRILSGANRRETGENNQHKDRVPGEQRRAHVQPAEPLAEQLS
jgi:ATP-dependent helicase/nuclease subunit A